MRVYALGDNKEEMTACVGEINKYIMKTVHLQNVAEEQNIDFIKQFRKRAIEGRNVVLEKWEKLRDKITNSKIMETIEKHSSTWTHREFHKMGDNDLVCEAHISADSPKLSEDHPGQDTPIKRYLGNVKHGV